jgi:hypothetical protein
MIGIKSNFEGDEENVKVIVYDKSVYMPKSTKVIFRSKITSIHTEHIYIAAALMLLIISYISGGIQYRLVNAQEDQSGGLASYANEQLGIKFNYPDSLVVKEIPGGVMLVPASEDDTQQHSFMIFVYHLSDEGAKKSPEQLIADFFQTQDVQQSNSHLPIVFATQDGQEGHAAIGNFGGNGPQEMYLYGFISNNDPDMNAQFQHAPATVINSMVLGHVSKATQQMEANMQQKIEQLREDTMRSIINNIGR